MVTDFKETLMINKKKTLGQQRLFTLVQWTACGGPGHCVFLNRDAMVF